MPVMFGGGRRLFEHLREPVPRFRIDKVVEGSGATHLRLCARVSTMAMDTEAAFDDSTRLLDDMVSGDPARIWSASCAIRTSRDSRVLEREGHYAWWVWTQIR